MILEDEAEPEASDMAAAAMEVMPERSRCLLVAGVVEERRAREVAAVRGDKRNLHGAADAAPGGAIKDGDERPEVEAGFCNR